MSTPPESGRALLAAVKAAAGGDGALSIPFGDPLMGRLRPAATVPGRTSADDAARITRWRNRDQNGFLTRFEATVPRTTGWLERTVGPDPGRILFMLDDAGGQPFGYLGLAFIDWERAAGELDSIVRGEPSTPGAMTAACQALLDWAAEALGLVQMASRVRSDNRRVLALMQRLGGREVSRTPLAPVETPDGLAWVESPTAGADAAALIHVDLAH